MNIFRKLLKVILWTFCLWVLIETLDLMRRVNFAQEIPELIWYQWTWLHWIAVVASCLVTLVWSYGRTLSSSSRPMTRIRVYAFWLVPLTIIIVLFLPALLAAPKVYSQIDLLDCTAKGIPKYVPEMVDYTWLVLDSLAKGASLGLSALLDIRMAKCVASSASPFAVWFVIAVRSAAFLLSIWTLYLLWRSAALIVGTERVMPK